MQFAIAENKSRIEARQSGEKAKCPLCKELVVARCGDIYIPHWSHYVNSSCDSWKEHETAWHRNWKARFPQDWREVIINNSTEKRIADVKTNQGLVIEFQNSSISPSTIITRENFYKRMIWIVNASHFKENLKLRSIVTRKLHQLKESTAWDLVSFEADHSEEIDKIDQEIRQKEQYVAWKNDELQKIKNRLERLKIEKKEIDTLVSRAIKAWSSHGIFIDVNFTVPEEFTKQWKSQLRGIMKQREQLKHEKEVKGQGLDRIKELRDYYIDGRRFVFIQYSDLNVDNYHKARTIKKRTLKTLFPEIRCIKNDDDYSNLKFQQNTFEILIDPADGIRRLETQIKEIGEALTTLENSLLALKETIKITLGSIIEKTIDDCQSQLAILNREYKTLSSESTDLHNSRQRKLDLQRKEVNTMKIAFEKELQIKKSKAMKEYKGMFRFYWKYERKSWQAANAPLYFDLGDTYLYEKVNEGVLKRIIVSEFLERNGVE